MTRDRKSLLRHCPAAPINAHLSVLSVKSVRSVVRGNLFHPSIAGKNRFFYVFDLKLREMMV